MVDAAYWHSTPVVLHSLAALQALAHMFIGIFLYDVFLSLPFDWQLLTSPKRRLHWVHLAYFGTRVSMLGYSVVALTLMWAQTEINCKDVFYLTELLMGTTVFASSVLLAVRTVCVYEGAQQRIIKIVITVMALALLAVWMQGIKDIVLTWSSTTGNPVWATGWCIVVRVKSTYWVKYVATIIFDAVILILTTVGVIKRAGSSSHVGMVLIQQGMAYFVLTLLANLFIMTLTLLQLNDVMSLLFAIPQSVICVICSCRLYRNLVDDLGNGHQVTRSPSSGGIKELDSFGNPTTLTRGDSFFQRLLYASSDLSATRSRGRLPSFVVRSDGQSGGRSNSPPFQHYLKQMPSSSCSTPQRVRNSPAGTSITLRGNDEIDFVAMLSETRRSSSNMLPPQNTSSEAMPSSATALSVCIDIQQECDDGDLQAQRRRP